MILAESVTSAASGAYSVGWFTLTLINAGLAQGKGRGGLNWWALSLVLGPVATLLIVLLDPLRDEEEYVPRYQDPPPGV